MSAPDLSPEQRGAIDRLFKELESGTWYSLLGVGVDASATDLQKAYYELSRSWHPDRFFRKEIGEYADRLEMVFVGITSAYHVLRDDNKRKAYERELREAGRLPGETARRSRATPAARPAPTTPPAAPAEAAKGPTTGPPPRAAREPGAPPPGSIRARLAARTAQGRATGASARVHNQFETTVRDQLRSSLGKARRFYEQGQQDYQAGHVIKAAGALELAVQFDPHNQDYQALLDKCKTEARQVRIVQLIHQGEQSESYQQYKQALHCYREAVELEPEDGKVYFRLARLVRHEEDNDREALNLLREAVLRDPDVIEYRMALGGLYGELGLKLNARREFQAVVALQKDHAEARAALKAL